MPPSPAMMRWDAMAMDCRPDEQNRFTVIPAVVTGSPARKAIWRAMFRPVAPSGLAQPMITSSTSAEWMPAGIGGEALHAVDDVVQAHLVGVEHRPAPVQGKTVTGQVDHVDVGSTRCNAVLQDRRPFVD